MVKDESVEESPDPIHEWYCEKGLTENLDLVKKEFAAVNNLKPIKIFVTGPPLAGKSYFGQKLSEEYNVPHIKIRQLIDEVEKMADNLEIDSEEYNNPVGFEQEITRKVKEYQIENLGERYPNEFLCEMVQFRLNCNDC
jgi:adenylate kinase